MGFGQGVASSPAKRVISRLIGVVAGEWRVMDFDKQFCCIQKIAKTKRGGDLPPLLGFKRFRSRQEASFAARQILPDLPASGYAPDRSNRVFHRFLRQGLQAAFDQCGG